MYRSDLSYIYVQQHNQTIEQYIVACIWLAHCLETNMSIHNNHIIMYTVALNFIECNF